MGVRRAAAARRPDHCCARAYPWGHEEPSNETAWRLNLWQGDFPRSDAALDGHAGLAPADAFDPSAVGLYGMLGNVWEWTSTYLSKSSGQRVLRGGSYVDSADGSFNHKVTASVRMGNTADSSADNMGFRCARSAAGKAPRKLQGYSYENVKKKRLPPGAADPIKEGGKGAEELVQAIAAEQGAEGLQQWMDKHGLGTDVMTAKDAMEKREKAKVAREEAFEKEMRQFEAERSWDDLSDAEARGRSRTNVTSGETRAQVRWCLLRYRDYSLRMRRTRSSTATSSLSRAHTTRAKKRRPQNSTSTARPCGPRRGRARRELRMGGRARRQP